METYTNKELYQISKYLNVLPFLIFGSIGAHFFPPALIITGLFCYIYSHKLSKAGKSSKPWLWGIFSLLPIVGFIAIFILVHRSVNILRENGVKASFLGVEKSEREALLEEGDES